MKLEDFTAMFSEKNNHINPISGDDGQQTESDRSKSKKFRGIRGRSSGNQRSRDVEAEGGRFEPERDFRCVWSADAQAHSNTLQSGEWGGGWEGE